MRALHVIQSYTILNSVAETLHKTVSASDTWHNTTVSIGPKRPVSIADRWHYITCTLVTQPVCQVTLHNLYARSHYTTCTSDHTTHLYIRSHYTTCTPGHWLDNLCARCHCSVYQVTSRNLYARCHNSICTPGRTKQPVHQATLHNCMPGDTAQPVRQVTLHNLYSR